MAEIKKTADMDEFDFELPPLPEIKTPKRTVDLSGNTAPDETEEKKNEHVRTIDDILSAPDGNGPVVVPKHGVDTSSEVRITGEESVDRAMAAAEAALEKLSRAEETDPFENDAQPTFEEEPAPSSDEPRPEEEDYSSDLDEVDTSDIVLDEMDSRVSYISTPADDAAKALKQMVMMDDMSMDMVDKPVLDDLSSDYVTVREKAKSDDLYRKDTLNDREKKALKDRMHEEIYRRPENFNKKTGDFLQEKLMAENRLKKAKKGLLITIGAMLLTLACAAATYLGLHEYNEAYTYLAAGTIIAALLMMVRSRGTRIAAIIYLAVNTLILAGPGLALSVLSQKEAQLDNFNQLVVGYTIPIILSGLAMFILSTSKNVLIYFTTDKEGKETKKHF
ncbi:MAG: hypothetical protein ACI4K7_08800 [Oscillospiraceae bacterium]